MDKYIQFRFNSFFLYLGFSHAKFWIEIEIEIENNENKAKQNKTLQRVK